MGFTGIPGLSTQLKNSYTRVILPFEHYSERVRNSPTLSPSTNRVLDPQLKTHQNIQTPTRMNLLKESPLRGELAASPPSSPLSSVSSSALSDDEVNGDLTKAPHPRPPKPERNGRDSSKVLYNSRVTKLTKLATADTTPKPRTAQTASSLLPAAELDPSHHGRTG